MSYLSVSFDRPELPTSSLFKCVLCPSVGRQRETQAVSAPRNPPFLSDLEALHIIKGFRTLGREYNCPLGSPPLNLSSRLAEWHICSRCTWGVRSTMTQIASLAQTKSRGYRRLLRAATASGLIVGKSCSEPCVPQRIVKSPGPSFA